MSEPIISIQNVTKTYRRADNVDTLAERLRRGVRGAGRLESFDALRDVSFDVEQGEVVGIIGRNGAGKSTLLKIISQITRPTSGRILVRGHIGSLLEVGTGFHPELTGRENVYLNAAIIGMRRSEVDRLFDEIVEFAETGDFIDTPLKHYSSGMQTRLAFSIAAHVDAQTLILDEVLSVGDFHFQRKCLEKIRELSRSSRTILLVSHNLATVLDICGRCVLLEGGGIAAIGDAPEVVGTYRGHGGSALTEYLDPSGQLRLYDVGFVDDSGTPVETAENDRPVRFGMKIDAKRAYREVALHVSLEDVNLQRLTAFDSRLTGTSFDLEPGTYGFSVGIAELPLAAGEYATKLKVIDVDGQVLWVESGPTLHVENGEVFGRRSFHIVDWHGPVHVRQEWRAERLGDVR